MTEHHNPMLLTELILYALKRTTDYDFTRYAVAAMERRVDSFIKREEVSDKLEILQRIAEGDTELMSRLIQSLTVTHSRFFRDADYFDCIQHQVIPKLKAFPKIRVWSLGCSTGEEVYSLAILLDLAGLLPQCSIMGTDINTGALDKAKTGCYELERLEDLQHSFKALKLPHTPSLLDYVELKENHFQFVGRLREVCHFRRHNLVKDASLGTMHLVSCRNVLIYLHPNEQERVIQELLVPSIELGGYLVLGEAENISDLAHYLDLLKLGFGVNIYQNTVNERIIG
ncbi:MAG: CheR family methyltransferase [Oleiphilaceae bacterium]|nr:CheR family methyltransferase [Oleiphilaceae bacterium]